MSLLQKLKLKYLVLWNDIDDLPLWNWVKIHETRSTVYLYKNGDYKNLKETVRSKKAMEQVHSSYIDYFGIDEKYRRYLIEVGKISIKRFDAFKKEDKSMLTFVEIDEQELKSKYPVTEADFNKVIAMLEKKLGFIFDKKKMTVKEFYVHLRNG